MSGLLSRARFRRRTAALVGLTGGGAWALGCGVVLLGGRRFRGPVEARAPMRTLVLGCPPGPAFERRLEAARALYVAGATDRVVVSGRGEAHWGVDWLRAAGVAPDALIAEPAARNTWENLRLSAGLLGEGPFHLVTDAWHMPRALLSARSLALLPVPAPAPGPFSAAAIAREGLAVVMTVSGGHVPLRRWWSWCVTGANER
ncbi:YdcF family protein [Myxococcota bacterium]|nr:YdcF family protein [Myxococcota bacterium]